MDRDHSPPTSYTNALKRQGILDYGYTDIVGAPKDPHNLWPEPHAGSENSSSKDSVENTVKRAVRAGQVTLTAAQNAMLTSWTTAKSALGLG
ncbi:hypothetical protein [Amycolatopsis sp. NPDC004378]